eukprot:SAG11_NODE_15190_length_586_cov_0.827515_1_plen_138_part_10
MPLPNQSATQVRGFLGMAGFYRKFVSDFAAITRPLNDLLKKGVKANDVWSRQHSDAVAKIKQAMTTYPVLRQYDHERQLHLVTDASDLARWHHLQQNKAFRTNQKRAHAPWCPPNLARPSGTLTSPARGHSERQPQAG